MKNIFIENHRTIRIIAGVLIACLALADTALYIRCAGSEMGTKEDFLEITEEHDLAVAYADGEFSGENSQSEQIKSGSVEGDSSGISLNIIEIVPEYGNGYFGYLAGGCESLCPSPTDIKDKNEIEEFHAKALEYMDAACNLNPGSNNNKPFNFDLQMDNDGVKHFGFRKDQEVEGYYERVADGTGVYAFVKADNINKVEMKSKATGENLSYNFDWHYGAPDSSKTRITDTKKIKKMKVGEVIYFSKYKKNVYGNNEVFLTMYYNEGKDSTTSDENGSRLSADIDGHKVTVDGTRGVYDIFNNNQERFIQGEYSNNKKVVDAWKSTNDVNVFVRTPDDLSDTDIENADFIIFNIGAPSENIVKLYNNMNKKSYQKKTYDGTNDFTWSQVLKIYEHVVNKQDLAIAMCRHDNGKNQNMNMYKLFVMIYGMVGNGSNECGSAREVFNDIVEGLHPTDSINIVKVTESDLRYSDYIDGYMHKDDWWNLGDSTLKYVLLRGLNSTMDSRYSYVTYYQKDPNIGQYRNSIVFEGNTQMTSTAYSTNYFRSMFKKRVKAEHKKTAPEPYYISMDILNGDSKPNGTVSNATNKVLYVNEYELKPGRTEEIPIHIRVYSSHDLDSVVVYKNAKVDPVTKEIDPSHPGTPVSGLEYTTAAQISNLMNDMGEENKTVDSGGSPVQISVHKYEDADRDANDEVTLVKLMLPVSELKDDSGHFRTNTNIAVVVTNKFGKEVADSIKVVKRNFFNLN